MLLELAIGDAYGAGFEFVSPERIQRANDLSGYAQHPRHDIRPGSYTDDTQMSLAISEALLSAEAWTSENLAHRFVEVFKRDPRAGYARGFHAFLSEVKSGAEFLDRIRPTSDKNGAAMRAPPLGVLPTAGEVIEKCRLQAALTHDTQDGIQAAQAAALMTHYFLYDLGPKRELASFLDEHGSGQGWSIPWTGKVGTKGWMSVRAALTALVDRDSLREILRTCVDYSGDVDTVAAIALAAGSCSAEIAQDLPENLVTGLEDTRFGRTYIRQLDEQLLRLVRKEKP